MKNTPETGAAPVAGLYKHAEHSANYEACLRLQMHMCSEEGQMSYNASRRNL